MLWGCGRRKREKLKPLGGNRLKRFKMLNFGSVQQSNKQLKRSRGKFRSRYLRFSCQEGLTPLPQDHSALIFGIIQKILLAYQQIINVF